MRWKPKDSVAIVTGASSGIGRCLTQILADRGAHVIAVARRAERIAEWNPSPGCDDFTTVIPVAGDITEPATRDAIADAAASLGEGQVDLLVNNAGIGGIGRFEDASPDRLRRIMEVNFFAPVELTRRLLPQLKRGNAPVICNISSVLAHRAVPDKSEYCASKFALHGWSDSLRAELSADGIQVTLVSPSTTRSDFFDALIETEPGQASNSIGSWPPERVARKAFTAICRRRSEVILSLGGKALVYGDRISPPLLNAILAKSKQQDH
ncbi:MAG: SDR family NAD(P)-dependent oxidoreductase [Rubripirellula sp.]